MLDFLSRYIGSLGIIQSKQVLSVLSRMRDKGELRSAADVQKQLSELSKLLNSDQVKVRTPYLTFEAEDLVESDSMNVFIDNIKQDMEAILGETENLSEVVLDHLEILNKTYFEGIDLAINELEGQLRAYEVLDQRKTTGFKSVYQNYLFDSSISVAGASKSDTSVSSLFTDSRGHQSIYMATPKEGDKGLHLPLKQNSIEKEHRFDSISIVPGPNSPQTLYSTATLDNIPLHAIDGNPDTAWKHSILVEDYLETCQLVLTLSFDNPTRVNNLVINPLSDLSMELISVSYIDSGNQIIELDNVGSSPTIAVSGLLGVGNQQRSDWCLGNRKHSFQLGDLNVRSLQVTFQQASATKNEFIWNPVYAQWQQGSGFDLMELSEIGRDIGIISGNRPTIRRGRFVEYSFGLKDIYTTTKEYHPNGLFVAEPVYTKPAPNSLALFTSLIPVDNTDIEFVIRKENFNKNDILVDVDLFPVLPYGDETVSERFFLTESYSSDSLLDTGPLRFYPDLEESFKVYSNDIELVLGVQYKYSVDFGLTWESSFPAVATPIQPYKFLIKILTPSTSAIYRVDYTPKLSGTTSGSEVYIDPKFSIRLDKYQTYVFDNSRVSDEIVSSKIALQIILRSNVLNSRITPLLKEVILLGG